MKLKVAAADLHPRRCRTTGIPRQGRAHQRAADGDLTAIGGAAVINNGFALDANLDPSSAIYNDDPSSPAAEPTSMPAFVARDQDKDNPTYLKIVGSCIPTPEVVKAVLDASRDTAVIVDKPAAGAAAHLTNDLEAPDPSE